jgi:hypothetical protein
MNERVHPGSLTYTTVLPAYDASTDEDENRNCKA